LHLLDFYSHWNKMHGTTSLKVRHYSLNMTHCRWPRCSLHSSLWIPWIPIEFAVLSDQYWKDVFRVLSSLHIPKMSCRMRRGAGQVMSANREVKLPRNIVLRACLHRNLCCVSSCYKHHFVWWRSGWKRHSAGKLVSEFQLLSGFSGAPQPPGTLLLQYQATSFGATSKARYMKYALPKLIT